MLLQRELSSSRRSLLPPKLRDLCFRLGHKLGYSVVSVGYKLGYRLRVLSILAGRPEKSFWAIFTND